MPRLARRSGGSLAAGSLLTPIPIDEAVASLSAILLDDDYYAFIMSGRRETDGLPWVGEDRLIPLKAVAWLDLKARHEKGEAVDAMNVRKHANDVLRLAQLLARGTRIGVVEKIARDLVRFLEGIAADATINPGALGLPGTREQVAARIRQAYEMPS